MTNADLTGYIFADLLKVSCEECIRYEKETCHQICGLFVWKDTRLLVLEKALEALAEIAYIGGQSGERESAELAHGYLTMCHYMLGGTYDREAVAEYLESNEYDLDY